MDRRAHWENVYRTRRPEEVSWFQRRADLSRTLILDVAPDRSARVVDVGGGASPLAVELVREGFRSVTVLDLAGTAFAAAHGPTGPGGVLRIVGDALAAPFAPASMDVWHDRAFFHFLVDAGDRARYVAEVRRVLRGDGHVVLATFGADGPVRCSGLPVVRYGPGEIEAAFGPGFEPTASRREVHRTPSGGEQPFTWVVLRRVGP